MPPAQELAVAQRFRPGATHADKVFKIQDLLDMVVVMPEDISAASTAALRLAGWLAARLSAQHRQAVQAAGAVRA